MFNVNSIPPLLGLGLLGLRLLADHAGHLDLLVLAHLAWLGPAQLEVLGDLLDDGFLPADGLGLLLTLHEVGMVGLGLSLVVEGAVVGQRQL